MKQSLLPIKLETRWALIEARLAREILGALVWLPIPKARRELPGVVAWRGRAVPLVDLGAWFGLPQLAPGEARARTVIVEHEGGLVALAVDAVREVRHVEAEALVPVQVSSTPYASAELDADETIMPLLNLRALLAELGAGGEDQRES